MLTDAEKQVLEEYAKEIYLESEKHRKKNIPMFWLLKGTLRAIECMIYPYLSDLPLTSNPYWYYPKVTKENP